MQSESTIFQRLKLRLRARNAKKELASRTAHPPAAKPHGLTRPLIVSLTSYSARFDTLSQTLTGALHQTMQPDRTILWVSRDDFCRLPKNVLALQHLGLEIGQCENMKSFTKIIPTLRAHPDSFIITLDDDVYYQQTLIEDLVAAFNPCEPKIVCHRAHEITMESPGKPKPYQEWNKIRHSEASSPLVFPTGVMGVLYPPGVFHEDTCKQELFTELSPTADDVWLYWMWRLTGHTAHRIKGSKRIIEWPGSQGSNLRTPNGHAGGNDACIANMIARYGFPA